MAKLSKQYYYTKEGERKVNCYHIVISRELIKQANIDEDDEVQIKAVDNKIIIEKKA